jgi:alcohol dehydrogenase class IV
LPAVTSFRHVSYPVRIYAGDNALACLAEEVDRTGAKRALVVCGQTVARCTNLLDRVKEALGARFASVFDGVEASSPLPSVELGIAAARAAEADIIIGVGGGSAV